ncbi:MAG: HTH domain-containing protein [Alsobacter sp.]
MARITPQDVESAYAHFYIRAQYTWVHMLAEHLADCSRVFRGDLQAMLVLAVIGQSYLYRHLQEVGERPPEDEVPLPVLAGTSINASSLSDILGIPRETVRRKLEDLRTAGWIEKDEKSGYQLAMQGGRMTAREALSELDQRQMKRVARMVAEFARLAQLGAGPGTD